MSETSVASGLLPANGFVVHKSASSMYPFGRLILFFICNCLMFGVRLQLVAGVCIPSTV